MTTSKGVVAVPPAHPAVASTNAATVAAAAKGVVFVRHRLVAVPARAFTDVRSVVIDGEVRPRARPDRPWRASR